MRTHTHTQCWASSTEQEQRTLQKPWLALIVEAKMFGKKHETNIIQPRPVPYNYLSFSAGYDPYNLSSDLVSHTHFPVF